MAVRASFAVCGYWSSGCWRWQPLSVQLAVADWLFILVFSFSWPSRRLCILAICAMFFSVGTYFAFSPRVSRCNTTSYFFVKKLIQPPISVPKNAKNLIQPAKKSRLYYLFKNKTYSIKVQKPNTTSSGTNTVFKCQCVRVSRTGGLGRKASVAHSVKRFVQGVPTRLLFL